MHEAALSRGRCRARRVAARRAHGRAEQKKDTKTFEALADKMDKMAEQLGPDYIALMDRLQDMDAHSKDAEAIGKTLDALDEKYGQ